MFAGLSAQVSAFRFIARPQERKKLLGEVVV
jgi:hypothetical protein